MRSSRNWVTAALIIVLLGTVWLFSQVIGQRFVSGRAYPPYSSLRSDPLGVKAFYEALGRLPDMTVRRNFEKIEKLDQSAGKTLLLLNVTPHEWTRGGLVSARSLQHFALRGGRVVVTLDAGSEGVTQWREEARQRRFEREKKEADSDADEKDKDSGKEKEQEERREQPAEKIFGVRLESKPFILTAKGGSELQWEMKGWNLESLPEWYGASALSLIPETVDQWKVIARLKGEPVIAERKMGRGSLVLTTDSYFASNEALWKEPSPLFLDWLLGDSREVIFDETHLGTRSQPGIMSLVRRFNLHGFFVGGILLFGFFVWQASFSLVPQRNKPPAEESVSGQGAVAGLVSLLRRGVSRRKLLLTSFESWEKSAGIRTDAMRKRVDEARQLLAEQTKNRPKRGVLGNTYHKICHLLHARR